MVHVKVCVCVCSACVGVCGWRDCMRCVDLFLFGLVKRKEIRSKAW